MVEICRQKLGLNWSSAPKKLTQEPAGQKRESACNQTCADVEADHGVAVKANIAFHEKPKRGDQTADRDGNQQVDPREVAPDIDLAANEHCG